MVTWPRLFLAYLLASLFCLGVWYYIPVPIPYVPVRLLTEASVQAEWKFEQKQKAIDRAARISARLYRSYGCPVSLAWPTAVNAMENRLSVRLVTAVVIVESTCRPYAVSEKGATGLMQIMPKMHHVSKSALMNQDYNLKVGTQFLAYLIRMYGIEEGLANYFGISPGSNAAWDYSFRVMEVAGY